MGAAATEHVIHRAESPEQRPLSMARRNSFKQASEDFRIHLPDLSTRRFTTAAKQNIYEYSKFFRDNQAPPWLFELTQAWAKLYEEPFKGITTDGKVRQGLYKTQDEGIEIEKVVSAAERLLERLDDDKKGKLLYPVSAREWRAWSNPEILLRPFGLRLEEVSESTTEAILLVIESSLSSEGYQKALAAMRINHFLGNCVGLPQIMNKHSYNFLLFGTPSTSVSSPWGWLLYGHHLCLSVFFKGPQIVISPTFTGAEPNIIDDGEWAGTAILHKEGNLGLKLMQSLRPEQQQRAQTYKLLKDPAMKQTGDLITDRWNKDDQRHMCGAFRDNRIIPYEGLSCSSSELLGDQQTLLLKLVEEFLLYLPAQSRRLRLQQIKDYLSETYFSWIGGYGDQDAFYFRIQSPVLICEFDHHSGVFLSNTEPAKFHIHTIVRTPNTGDYGEALRGPDTKLD